MRKAAGAPESAAHEMTIVPAFEWAQSLSHVYLRVKWAHKIDVSRRVPVSVLARVTLVA